MNVRRTEPEERVEIDLNRRLPVLMTLCFVVPSRKAKVTEDRLETATLSGENAMFFNVTVLPAAPDAATVPPNAAAQIAHAASSAFGHLVTALTAADHRGRITGARTDRARWRAGSREVRAFRDEDGYRPAQ